MTETKERRRGWVKNAAIIFLAVLLVLTFFSNTWLNRSLPEVAAQYPTSGSINLKIRGEGTVSANQKRCPLPRVARLRVWPSAWATR